jgi:hypothetical protein
MTDRTAVLPDQSRVPVPANVGAVWPPSKDMLDPNAYAVNVPNMMECITQPLFFYQSYPAAGPTAPLKFFGATAGQNLGSATLTAEDTNMQQGGTLPAPQKFLIQGIGFDYISGNAVSRFGAQAANGLLNDFYAVMKRGRPVLTIGSKSFFTETTLIQLPMRAHIGGMAAVTDATTAAASLQTYVSIGYAEGAVFSPKPLLIEASQNFDVTVFYDAAAPAIPSGDTGARIGCTLYGSLFRPVQ